MRGLKAAATQRGGRGKQMPSASPPLGQSPLNALVSAPTSIPVGSECRTVPTQLWAAVSHRQPICWTPTLSHGMHSSTSAWIPTPIQGTGSTQ